MLTTGYAFIIRSGDVRKREIARAIMPRVPLVGEQVVELTATGEVRKRYKIEEVVSFLYPSGDNLVSDNDMKRPYGEIVLQDLKLAESKGPKKTDNAPFDVPAGFPAEGSFVANLSSGEDVSPALVKEARKKNLARIPDEGDVDDLEAVEDK